MLSPTFNFFKQPLLKKIGFAVCGGDLPAVMAEPLRPPANLTSYLCRWRLDADAPGALNKTLAVRVRRLDVGSTTRYPCHKYSSRLTLRRPGGRQPLRL